MKGKISVIMPLYNAENFVFKAIDSILNQTYENFELLLIDDCSNDSTMDVVSRIHDNRIRLIHNDKNHGIAFSRNVGLDNATGEFIAHMDDDDISPLNRFEKEINFLNTNPDIDAVGGRFCRIDENDKVYNISDDTLQNPKYIKAVMMFRNPIGNGSMMYRADIAKKNKIFFRDNCYGMEDYLFWVDFSFYGSISNLKDIMLYWRSIKGNETSRTLTQHNQEREKMFFWIRKHMMEKSGIFLPDEDCNLFCQLFSEGKWSDITKKELCEAYRILKCIATQAKEKKLDNASEIMIACKKQFSMRIEHSNIW